MTALSTRAHLSPAERAARAERAAERRRKAAELERQWREHVVRESLAPSWPPAIPFSQYAPRAADGSLILFAEPVGGGGFVRDGLRIARMRAESGASWIEAGEVAR